MPRSKAVKLRYVVLIQSSDSIFQNNYYNQTFTCCMLYAYYPAQLSHYYKTKLSQINDMLDFHEGNVLFLFSNAWLETTHINCIIIYEQMLFKN